MEIAFLPHTATPRRNGENDCDDGTLKLVPVGGYMMESIEGEYCTVHTRDGRSYTGTILTTEPSVHVFPECRDQKRTDDCMRVRLGRGCAHERGGARTRN